MRIQKIVLIATILLVVSTTEAFAFDDKRKGFLLGLGAGLQTIDENFKQNGSNILSQSKNGLATSFKIGGGITDQFALYYVRNASWFSAPFQNGSTTEDVVYTIGLSGVGASYFLSPSVPSGYFLGAFGLGDKFAPLERNVKPDTGSAWMFGGGYEFKNHVMVEATWLSANINSSGNSQLSLEASSLQLAINYVFY